MTTPPPMPAPGPTRIGDAATIFLGDCREILPTLPDASVDCVLADPPYPEIARPYGRMTEPEWHAMMDVVVPECRRILKPSGSAVFILQPNSERVGRMRLWLWEFMVKWGREWGIVQDVWWWNIATLPGGGATNHGLLRSSLKPCVWLGLPDCWRHQDAVLDRAEKKWMSRRWDVGQSNERVAFPSGNSVNRAKCLESAVRRGGVTPFNVLPMGNGSRHDMAGMHGHGAGTPINLADWWLRYLCPPGGVALDPFLGSGTTILAALKQGKSAIGIEKMPTYFEIARSRIAAELDRYPLIAEPAAS
jgi:DNA modification methylase